MIVGALLWCGVGAGQTAETPDPAPLSGVIEQARVDWNVPGLSVAIVKDGQVLLAGGFGVRETGKQDFVDADTVKKAIVSALRPLGTAARHTLTTDNGTEFAEHKAIETQLGMKIYFAHPYSSWERGTNENTNGLIRQYFPKGMDLKNVSPAQLAHVERKLNNRPRKCLEFQTPSEVFYTPN
ncbi:MAG: IS30 family transposase [Planctomycetaceae bacterium]